MYGIGYRVGIPYTLSKLIALVSAGDGNFEHPQILIATNVPVDGVCVFPHGSFPIARA